ncbi:MAG: hypothetical protein JRH16_04650 [Deltaproteobacteria bacterium]|nr:hypothetical protein [Deltaproteobacteria bacterium]MBW2362552.1 hypothetical protein [Deltaproteobacteria bacterium]
MKRGLLAACACALAACMTPLQQGERLYHEGDRLAALEVWRAIPDEATDAAQVRARIDIVEAEFERLVVQYKQRGHYYEAKQRLAESILNYRLALKLQPDDDETLAHVQELARVVATRKAELQGRYAAALAASDLPGAREQLASLRSLDPFDPELETDARQLRGALRDAIETHMAMGKQGFATGNIDTSQHSFRAVLELDPDNESARGYLSYIATLQRDAETSGPVAFEASAPFATDAEIRAEGFYQNALASERKGELYAAIRHDLHSLDADAEHEAARRHLNALRRRLASNVPTLIEAGRAAFRAEDLQSALDHWRQALLVAPDNERIIAYIARAEQQLQNLEELRADPAPRRSS